MKNMRPGLKVDYMSGAKRELPKVKVSILPTSAVPENCFEFSHDPEPMVIMDVTKKAALSFIYEKLNELAERKKEYEKLPKDSPERVVFEIRHWLVVSLTITKNHGELRINDLQDEVKRWKNYDPELFIEGVHRAIDDLGLVL